METQISSIHYKDLVNKIDFTKKLKIAVVAGDRSGPFYHDFGVPIPWFHAKTGLEFCCFDTLNPLLHSDYDIVHFQRQYAPESALMLRKVREEGKVVMAQVDDNVWELPATNPAKDTYQGETLERFEWILSESHAVCTSTPYLKKIISQHNPNVYILRHLVDPTITKFRFTDRDNPDEIRIGWFLTPHHAGDAPIVTPALHLLCQKYPQIKLVFMGWLPPDIPKLVPRNRYEFYDFVPVDNFYACLGALDFDIGIAPLEDNPFNLGKTDLKAQEYAILKIPMVLSPVPCYIGWEHNKTCIKPTSNTTKAWVTAIERLICNPRLREALVEAAYKQVIENHSIETYIYERAVPYYETYEKVMKGEL